MAPEDRDRSFDKALSRQLRSNAVSGAAADLRTDNAAGPSCLDLEMLADYHERSLLPEEMNSAKEHIVGCARCQSILAELEMTDGIPLVPADGRKEQVLAAVAPKAPAPIPIRGPRWVWLVPAGALAAGLLVWIGLHENRANLVSHDNEIKMAKAEESAPPVPMATRQAPATPPADQVQGLYESSRAKGGAASGAVSREMDVLKQQRTAVPGARVNPNLKLRGGIAGNEKELRKDSGRDSSVAQHLADKADLDAKNVPVPQLTEQVQVQAQAENVQVQNQVNSQRVLGPASLNQATPAKKTKSESAAMNRVAAAPPAPEPPQSAPVAGFAASTASTALESAVMVNPHLISAPGSGFLWRAGHAGLIEFSRDNGASWSRQISGVLTDLTTGTASAPNVCWIVGRVGTILLTVDGGAHWSLIHSPVSEDLGGIRAVDALHATIWNLRNTKSFETTDGGITWKPVPAP